MDRCSDPQGHRRFHHLASLNRDAEVSRNQGLRGGRAKTNNHLRPDAFDLSLKPWAAGGDFFRVRLLVNSEFAARGGLEVLDDIRDVDALALNSGLGQSFVQQLSSRAHERPPFEVFAIAGLLTYEHNFGSWCAFTQHRLRGALPQIAAATLLYEVRQIFEGSVRLDQ